MKRKIDMVCLDWEGCVSEPGGGKMPWPTRNIALLAEVIQVIGVPVILVTGRQAPYGEAGLQSINAFSDVPSVLENGAVLYYPKTKRYLFNQALTAASVEAVQQARPRIFKWGQKFGLVPELGKEICISLAASDKAILPTALAAFRAELGLNDLFESTHSASALDICPVGVNKLSGLEQVLAMHSIDATNVLGVGDALNDMVWLDRIGVPCCPANADEDIKKIVSERGGHVATEQTTLGVIEILKFFC